MKFSPVSPFFKWFLLVWISGVIVAGFLLPVPFIPVLKETARNIYFHVPQSFTMIFMLAVSVWNSIQYLRKNHPAYDLKAESAAAVAMVFGLTTIVTGAIWAEYTWGVFWNWDPKQTLFLGLLLIYASYFVLRMSVDDPGRRAKLSAAYNLFAFVVMPFLVFVVPRMLPGLHPGAPEETGANNPVITGVDLTIRLILYSSVIGFWMLAWWMYNLRVRFALIKERVGL